MDPKHRDCIAFIRMCSGQFKRNMSVIHQRTGNAVRLASSHKLFARERETVEEGFAGDVIGIVGHPEFRIGDTLSEDAGIIYREIPRFAPECFAYLYGTGASQHKRFFNGLDHLLREGVVHVLQLANARQRIPLLGAVGPLQFDVVQYRLQSEYGAESRLEPAPWERLRWIDPNVPAEVLSRLIFHSDAALAVDSAGDRVILFCSDWEINYFSSKHPDIGLSDTPFTEEGAASLVEGG
jgi:peptide chain release factor 3